jgi:hypothetical protein
MEAVLKDNNTPNNLNAHSILMNQLMNKPGIAAAKKGVKDVHVFTLHERGQIVTVITCSSSEGQFLPTGLILKGVNKNLGIVFLVELMCT